MEVCTISTRENLIAVTILNREKGLDTALRNLFQFRMGHLHGMFPNGLLYRFSNRLVQKWPLLRPCQVPHSDECKLSFSVIFLPDDSVSVLGIKKPALHTNPIFVLNNDGKVLSEDVHDEISEQDVSVLTQFKIKRLAQQGAPLSRFLKRQNIVPLPKIRDVFKKAGVKSSVVPFWKKCWNYDLDRKTLKIFIDSQVNFT